MVTIKIETDNAAFHDDNGEPSAYTQTLEVARILRKLTHELETSLYTGNHVYVDTLMDVNGNRVGEFIMDPPVKEDSHEKA